MSQDDRITDEVLKISLSKQFGVDALEVEIDEWTSEAGAGDADNFACDMVAVNGKAKIKGEPKEFAFMAKVGAREGWRVAAMKESEVFEKECFLYGTLLPILNEERVKAKLSPIKIPKCYYAACDPDIMVMENLKHRGFTLLRNRQTGLVDTELEFFLKALAEFHATTFHYLAQYPGGREAYLAKYPKMETMNEPNEAMMKMFRDDVTMLLETFAEIAKEHFGEDAHNRLTAFSKHGFDLMVKGFFRSLGDVKTLIHGDAWFNNALFKYSSDDGPVEEFVMLDFQCCRMSSPGIDLAYNLVTSTRYKQRKDNLDSWLTMFHKKLAEDLKAFGHDVNDVYPFGQLMKDFDEFYGYGFITATQHTQLVIKDDAINIGEAKNAEMSENNDFCKKMSEAYFRQMKKDPVFREIILGLIEEGLKRGAI